MIDDNLESLSNVSPLLGVRCKACDKSWIGRATYADAQAIRLLAERHALTHRVPELRPNERLNNPVYEDG